MNKKITSSALAALMIAGSTSFSALAAMSNGTVVIGNKAFDLAYANDPKNAEEITNAIVAGGAVYVKDFEGNWIDNTTGKTVAASVIPAVTYKSATKEIKFDAADKDAVASAFGVSAVTAKSLKVTFTGPVDTTKAVLTVKRDGIKSNVSTITWSADKTVATIELTSKLSKAVYTVDVTGVDATTLTASVSAEDEKVSKIEVLSTEVPLSNLDADGNVDDLAVPYKVTNQYGENITKITSIIASNGVVDATKGVVNFVGNYDTITNKTVAFTLINVDSNVSTTGVVTAVSAAKDSSIEIKGIYNKDGKTLTETTDLAKDKFFVEIEVKDQYGNVVASPKAADMILSETNNTIADIDDSVVAGQPVLDTTTVDGKILVAIKRPAAGLKAGETGVTLISRNTGKSASTTVKVAEGIRVNNVTLGQPELVAFNEDALIPVTALDKEGNEIKDLDILNNSSRGLALNGNTLIKKNEVVYLKVVNPAVGPNVAMVTVIPTQKIVTVNYTVKAAVAPTVIAGLDKGIQTSISSGLTQEIKGEDLIIEDQYGRVMSDTAVKTWLDSTTGSAIILTSSKDSLDNSPFTVASTANAADAATQVIAASTDKFTLATSTAVNSTEKMTFTLSNDGTTPIPSTSKDVVFTRVGLSDFASYEISAPTAIFNDTATHSIKVYGVKADGTKTLLQKDQYNLVNSSAFTISGANNNTFALTTALATTGSSIVIDEDDSTTTVPLTKNYTFKAVINDAAATVVSKVVTVSAESKYVADFKLTSDGTSDGTELSKLIYEASVANNDSDIKDLATGGKLDITTLEQNIYYIDQYGNETAAPIAGTIYLTFASVVDKDTTVPVVITKNGSSSAYAFVNGLEAGDTLKTTITIGSVTKTFDTEIK